MQILKTLYQELREGERVQLVLERKPQGETALAVIPLLNDTEKLVTENPTEETKLRAALTIPLSIQGSMDEIDTQMRTDLAAFLSSRSSVHDTLDTLNSLKEAAKHGKAAVAKQKAATTKDKAKEVPTKKVENPTGCEAPPPPAQAETVRTENPNSLF
jgi:PRTRC genetic system protein E